MSMKVIKKDVSVTLHGTTFLCDLVLGVYANNKRPAIILVDASSLPNSLGETVAIASTNAPGEYLTGMPQSYFAGKNYLENKGLWEQLEPLFWEETNAPLFLRTSKRLTLGHAIVPVYDLGPDVEPIFSSLLESL